MSFTRPGLAWQKAMNSLKSMLSSPSVSISAITWLTSSALVEPRVRRTSESSASETFPSPLVSKRLKILSISGVTPSMLSSSSSSSAEKGGRI
ncbi:hypothetical protein ZIOFF_006729 [Zingiber officinale]|uniref:Uncharacterized protein n=1 Tax=Zingiber officinale TaxID=94328 RepID=A0A8J5LP81_ZINOF|nr:hypothetical protein ZIOFF_006729 [Zingiber officinale]